MPPVIPSWKPQAKSLQSFVIAVIEAEGEVIAVIQRDENMTQRISLSRYLVEQQRVHGHIPSQLRLLIEVVARACKRISHSVNKGALGDVLGTAGSENVQGEVQKKLDLIANGVLIEANGRGGALADMASEEME